MKRIKFMFNSVLLKRMLVIFLVGLVFRILVNLGVEMNIIDNYYYLGIIYYSMSSLLMVIWELPHINYKVFNVKLVRDSINYYIENRFKSEDKIMCGVEFSDKETKSLKSSVSNEHLSYAHNNSGGKDSNRSNRAQSAGVGGLYGNGSGNGSGNRIRRPSAAIIGLYSKNSSGSGNIGGNVKHSLGDKLRCKILWFTWMKYSDNYSSYKHIDLL